MGIRWCRGRRGRLRAEAPPCSPRRGADQDARFGNKMKLKSTMHSENALSTKVRAHVPAELDRTGVGILLTVVVVVVVAVCHAR